MNHPVNRQAFTAWLEEQEDSEVLGEACRSDACPITNYIRETNPSFCFIITSSDWVWIQTDDGEKDTVVHRKWLSKLIAYMDQLGTDPDVGQVTEGNQRLITAGQLKEILRRVP